MSALFKKMSFGVKKPKQKKEPEERKELSIISEETIKALDEIREKMIGTMVEKNIESTPRNKQKHRKKQPSIQIVQSQRKRTHSESESEEEELEQVDSLSEIETKKKNLIDEIRRVNRIFTWGDDISEIILRFSDANLNETLLRKLTENSIKQPSPIQMQSIPLMMSGRNLLSSAPTGSGKTLAFALPVIDSILNLKKRAEYSNGSNLLAIVLEPTRELAAQTHSEFEKYCDGAINCCNFTDEESFSKAEILVSTPNRIVFHLGKLDTSQLRWLVVDESDRLFEVVEGQEKCFRNQLAAIYKTCDAKCTRVAFFSATFSQEVEKWCKENIENIGMVCIGERNSSNSSVKQELRYCGTEDGKKVAIKTLLKTQFKPPALVFVQSKERAAQLVKLLYAIDSSLKVDSINSDKSDKERDETMIRFRKGEIWVLICTELLGRGLDLSDVGLVVNYDLPTSIISYIHRVGRTGRAGNVGHAVTYFTDSDVQYIKSIATVIRQSGFEVPEYLLEMKKVSRNQRKDLLKRAPKRQRIAVVKEQVKKHKKKMAENLKKKEQKKKE